MQIDAFTRAQRFIGIKEVSGAKSHPLVSWWLSLCGFALDTPDSVPWCSAFVNGICWDLRLPRSKSAAARSWLTVGQSVALADAKVGNDVVILKRSSGGRGTEGPEVLDAPGHVGFFAGTEGPSVLVLGGNQGDAVSVARFDASHVLGVRRLA